MPESSQLTAEQRQALEEKIKNMSPEQLKGLQRTQCIFCQIISGKIPSKKLYEDDSCLAILDINPATRGHLLILPKEHYAIMTQIPDKLMGRLMNVAKTLSKLLLKALRADGTTVFIANGLVAGQKAQHFILHLIPRKEGDKILNLDEKLLDAELLRKVKEVLQPKMEGLLGMKKAVKKAEKTKPAKKPAKKTRKTKEAEIPEIEENETILDDISELFT